MSGLLHQHQFFSPRPRSARRGGWFLGVAAVALGSLSLAGCSTVKPSALRVGDARVSRDDLQNDLKAYETLILSLQPTAADRASMVERIHTKADGGKAWNPAYTAFILSNRIRSLATDAAYVKTGIRTIRVTKELRAKVVETLGGTKTFGLLPKVIQERELRLAAQPAALVSAKVKTYGTPEQFFKSNAGRFVTEACTRHILVASEPEAEAIRKRILAGADFAAEAKTKSSDKGSGANGGDLGCGDPAQFVPEFAQAARSLKLGELSKPIRTQFGFHLLQVKSRKAADFASSKGKIAAVMTAKAQDEAQADVLKAAADVSVDPAFGTIAPDQSGFPSVVANPTSGAAGQPAPASRG